LAGVKALDVTVPLTLLGGDDEVMELRGEIRCWHFSEVSAATVNFRFQCTSGPRKFHDRRGTQFYCLFAE
jgi:hypothetical protein